MGGSQLSTWPSAVSMKKSSTTAESAAPSPSSSQMSTRTCGETAAWRSDVWMYFGVYGTALDQVIALEMR